MKGKKEKKDFIETQESKWQKRSKFGVINVSLAVMSINKSCMVMFTRKTYYSEPRDAVFVMNPEQTKELHRMLSEHIEKTKKIDN